ncbi:MAG: Dam family site-specific DNA-(adenine-N6)-methyltransferase [Oscillospiraceae bacterium]|nr:Dam family site-specific DNA-(adenine-N6)-methyltransferase [Oscillospiraceae bacterium]
MRFIGGKTQLLGNIEAVINENASGHERIFCDIFSGTGSVAKYFKPKYEIHSNDFLHFSYVIQKATVENNHKPAYLKLSEIGITDPLRYLEEADVSANECSSFFITDNYAPNENSNRMYITKSNAMRIDYIRSTIEAWYISELINEVEYYHLLASLIEGVPYVSNIAGTYGAYLKQWDKRAYKTFEMARLEVFDNGHNNKSYNSDANKLIREIEGDILYIDPPYNSRQYAPNYHLLETISRYDNPEIRGVTGMRPYDDIKSAYSVKSEVTEVYEDLIANANFSNIIMSYSTEGIMSSEQIETILKRYGDDASYRQYNIPYRKYKSKVTNETKTLYEYIFYINKDIPKTQVYPILSVAEKNIKYPIQRTKYLKSPLNYIGGKYKILPQILSIFPDKIDTFVDLFAGGCNVGINVNAKKIICNDLNSKIIEMYNAFLQIDTEEILNHIENRIAEYSLSKDNEDGFRKFRNHYNDSKNPLDLYTLTCFSFNYQFRFNNNLEYNNPFGRNRSQFSENMKNNLLTFLARIKEIDIVFSALDFIEIDLSALAQDDLVYCDPPYLITTGSYNDGNRGFKDWKETQEIALYEMLEKLDTQSVKFALSNVLTHKGNENKILNEWCKKYTVHHIENSYTNASYNAKRGESEEVLITNF